MSSELKKQMRSGGGWLFMSNIITIVGQVFSIALLSRILQPGDFGLQGICMLLIELTAVFTYPFINKSIILRKELDAQFLGTATTLSFLLSAALGLIFFLSAPLLAQFFQHEQVAYISRCIGLVFLLRGFYQPYQSLFEKELRFKEISTINLIAFWTGYFVVPVGLAFAGFGFKALVWGLISYEAVLLVYFTAKSNIYFGSFKPALAKEVIADARHMIIQAAGNKLATNGDYLIISKFLGPVALGFYSQAYKIMKMPTNIIGNVINSISFAGLAKVREDNEKLHKAFIYSSFLLALVSLPIFAITLLYAEEIITLLMGAKWLPAALSLQILAFGIFLRMAYKIPGTILKTRERFALVARIQVIYAVNIIIFSLCLLRFSVEGVAAGTLLALILQYAQLSWHVHKELKVSYKPFFTALWKPIVFSAVLLGLLYSSRILLQATGMGNIAVFLVSVTGSLALCALFIALRGKQFFGAHYNWWLEQMRSSKKGAGKKKHKQVAEPAAV